MEQFANNPTTTLSAAITSTSATSITVTGTTNFPASGTFRILVDGEIMAVTAVSGTTWTVTRGNGGSVATTHLNSAAVYGILTAEALNAGVTIQAAGTEVSDRRVINFVSGETVADNSGSGRADITVTVPPGITYGAGASRSAAGTAGRVYVPSDGIMASLDNGTSWLGFNPYGQQFTIPPLMSTWTTVNGSDGTFTDIPGGGINLLVPTIGSYAIVGAERRCLRGLAMMFAWVLLS